MKKLIVILLLLPSLCFGATFRIKAGEYLSPKDLKPGIYYANTTSGPIAAIRINWVNPGAYWFAYIYGTEPDLETPASPAVIAAATTELAAMPQEAADMIELYWLAPEKKWSGNEVVVMVSGITTALSVFLENYNASHFQFLGNKYSEWRAKPGWNINKRKAFYKDDRLDVVISGWEFMND